MTMNEKGQAVAAEERDVTELLQSRDDQFIQILSHLRHDWMNDIQVLYGYLRLKKYEKLQDYVETIRHKALRDSQLSRIGDSRMVLYLQSFPLECRELQLDVDVAPEFSLAERPNARAVTELAIGILELFKRHVTTRDGEPKRLEVKFYADEHELHMGFDYHGDYEQNGMRDGLEALLGGRFPELGSMRRIGELEPQWAAITIQVPMTG